MEVEECAEQKATDKEEEKKEKRERKRQRKLIGEVQRQLEFYFGNANLRHDRFLRKEIESNREGYVQIDTMLKFNKLKEMTGGNREFILMAVKNSQLIQADEQGKQIKRMTPIPAVENADAQTVYVEHLPLSADHDWLRKIFSICGNVEYISLPRFKHSGAIKGFAFVEYSTKEEADKACRVLNTLFAFKDKHKEAEEYGQTLRDEVAVTSSEPTESQETAVDETRDTTSLEDSTSSLGSLRTASMQRFGKRRRCVSESEANDPSSKSPKKRRRTKTTSESSTENTKSELTHNAIKAENRRKRKRTSSSNVSESGESVVSGSRDSLALVDCSEKMQKASDPVTYHDINQLNHLVNCKQARTNAELSSVIEPKRETIKEVEVEKESDKKKRSKRKRKKKEKEKTEIAIPSLYVISKAEWLIMKKKYKDLQRAEMRHLKGTLTGTGPTQLPSSESQPTNEETTDKGPKVPIQKGTVLRISSANEELCRKTIKDAFPSDFALAYIDIKPGSKEGFLRFQHAEDSRRALKSFKDSIMFSLASLTGEEESNYFHKVEEDRKARYERKNCKKERGIEKVKIKKKMAKVKKQQEEELLAKKQHLFFGDN